MLNGAQLKISAVPEAEVLGTLTLPISGREEMDHFGSAISNPPMVAVGTPALVRHRYGKGEVLYVAGLIEQVSLDFHRKILAALLKNLLPGRPIVETNAPQCVECTLFDQPEQRRLVFSCLNLPAELPALPLYDLSFRIRIPAGRTVKLVRLAPDDRIHPFRTEADAVVIEMEKLAEFALFVLEY